MIRHYDVIILGGGIAGLSTAVSLGRRGKRVLVIEKKSICGRASRASAGILDPFFEAISQSPLLALSLHAFYAYPALIRDLTRQTQTAVDFQRTGMLAIALTVAEEKVLFRRFQWQKKLNLPVRWLDTQELRSLEPSLHEKCRAAIFYATVGRVHPGKLMDALESLAEKSGVKKVVWFQNVSLIVKQSTVYGVKIGREKFWAPYVINATGCWAGNQVSPALRLPVQPVRGQLLMIRAPFGVRRILHGAHGGYLVPWGKQDYVLGSTVERVGYRPYPTLRGKASILRAVGRMIGKIREARVVRSWAGLRPCTPDHLPVIGPSSKIHGLYHATGYCRSGILLGPYVGELLAQAVHTGRIPKLLKPFNPRRFQR